MRHLPLILVLTLTLGQASAQPESAASRTAAAAFEKYYNSSAYDSIFALFAPNMAAALPPDKTRAFLAGLKTSAGQILRRQFVNYRQTSAAYKTSFDHGIFNLYISLDSNARINGFSVEPVAASPIPAPARNTTRLQLPFTGEWTVAWGGDTKALNHHADNPAQKNAFDFLITGKSGSTHRGDGARNPDYYAFGQLILAPCAGTVVMVVDGIPDNEPGTMDPAFVTGNTVIIQTKNSEYLFFCHFSQHSIVVRQGQQVHPGQALGRCGNSGNSSEPHLHFHIQNNADINTGTGIKCFFDRLFVNGQPRTDYSPVQKDRISTIAAPLLIK
jgi:murein DD-endopeptidase MepM/ murein hydrolase activator NlpD